MINNTFDLLWRDISPFTIGFDRTFDTLSLLANSKQQSSNYPPYNIRKVSEDKYTIELALAGFEEKEIDIEKELKLKIRSLQNEQLNQYSNIYYKKIKKDILINEK